MKVSQKDIEKAMGTPKAGSSPHQDLAKDFGLAHPVRLCHLVVYTLKRISYFSQ
jgi:hypothetical protein